MSCLLIFLLQVTFVDFVMYELLDQHRILEPTILEDSPKLKAFLDRIEVRLYKPRNNEE